MGGEETKDREVLAVNAGEWEDFIENVVDGRSDISYDELLTFAPEIEEDGDLFVTLVEDLSGVGVTVVLPEDGQETEEETPKYEIDHLDRIRPEDLLTLYLSELSQEPLLTHAEEVALASQIEIGRMARQTLKETDYNAEEYERLETLVEAGQAAREKLGRANMRLVVSIAKRYRGYGIPFTDLIQDGNVGLMRAVDRFDHRTGNRFSTYATWWIRQAVTRSLSNHGRLIRIPVHTGGRIRKMTQVAQRLEMEQGEQPTPEEIAIAMDESPEKVRDMVRWSSSTLSLEQPVGDDGEAVLQDFVEDLNLDPLDELTDVQLLNETLDSLLKHLKVREVRILRMRYGLQGAQTHTLGQIGTKLGLSRERVRQIEREALAKLRMASRHQRLEQFL